MDVDPENVAPKPREREDEEKVWVVPPREPHHEPTPLLAWPFPAPEHGQQHERPTAA